MLQRARQPLGAVVVDAKISRVHGQRLSGAAALEEERALGVAHRLHPAPGLVVGQGVSEGDGGREAREGVVVAGGRALAEADLGVEHGGGDGEEVGGRVVEEGARGGDAGAGAGRVAEGGVGEGFGVEAGCVCDAEERGVLLFVCVWICMGRAGRIGHGGRALAEADLGVEHGGGDGEEVGGRVVEEGARGGDAGAGAGRVAEGGVGEGFGVEAGCVCDAEERGVFFVLCFVLVLVWIGVPGRAGRIGHGRQGENVVPAAEADEHVGTQGEKGLEAVGHGRRGDAQQGRGQGGLEAAAGVEGEGRLGGEEGGVDEKVVVVAAVEGVKVEGPGVGEVALVGGSGARVGLGSGSVGARQDVEVRGHVEEVAGVGDEGAQVVGGREAVFWVGRHFEEVNVEVQQTRVLGAASWRGTGGGGGRGGCGVRQTEGAVEDGPHLERMGAGRRLACLELPHVPGVEVHDGVDANGDDVEIVGKLGVDSLHGMGKGEIPGLAVGVRFGLGISTEDGGDEGSLHRRHSTEMSLCLESSIVALTHDTCELVGVEKGPGFVVVWADAVGEAPIGHGTGAVMRNGAAEAFGGFFMVESIRPNEAAVEPCLAFGRGGGHGAGVCAEVERVFVCLVHAHAARVGEFRFWVRMVRG
ncbi:hypothetical protein BN1723_008873 [Verticillium longisporum]|uniref:Uncharacterized protein n=1 Tax=Verticillium longisporum TaxID=100787 RepID=A0A0G4KKD8_VERLO|nr:hypothetical protein BN1723_008873 [Verticillium longisporum]